VRNTKKKIGGVLQCENSKSDFESGMPWLDGITPRELKAVVIEAKAEQEFQHTSGPAKDVTKKKEAEGGGALVSRARILLLKLLYSAVINTALALFHA
jgi:hypothetical protein